MKKDFEHIKSVDLDQLNNLEQAKSLLVIYLNLLETVYSENYEFKKEVQKLSNEINRLKGEQGKPDIAANNNTSTLVLSQVEVKLSNRKAADKKGTEDSNLDDKDLRPDNKDVSSEKERKSRDGTNQGKGKKERGKQKPVYKEADVNRTEKCELDHSKLPCDAEFKGYTEHVVYTLEIKSVRTVYQVAQYYSKKEGKSYSADIPEKLKGKYSSDLKAYIIDMYHGCRMTESSVLNFLKQHGIHISRTTISNILIKKDVEIFKKEKQEIQKAGIETGDFTGIDDTSVRVNGVNQYAEILSGKYFTTFNTVKKKNRLNVIATIQGLKSDEDLKFFSSDQAIEILKDFGVAAKTIDKLLDLPVNKIFNRVDLGNELDRIIPELKTQSQKYSRVLEAMAIAYYNHQTDYPLIENLLCDDAPQFKKITLRLALCWVHDGRNYKKLNPLNDKFRVETEAFLDKYWDFYHKLLAYKKVPSKEEANKLEAEFDALFTTKVAYEKLQERIDKTLLNKTELLLVLEHPNIPLHNNESELAARQEKLRGDISFQTISTEGTEALDTYLSIYDTCRKLGVIPSDYIRDRISGEYEMQALAELIRKRTAEDKKKTSVSEKVNSSNTITDPIVQVVNDKKKTIVINQDSTSNTVCFVTAPIKRVPKCCLSP